ncbi:crossover junction endodeoxyribonuclease RuvC [Rhodothermus profundi]|uniref:Crossover junction endodeoxyribonuclease RuvC n=1 Tax=Rhodothermus profundi TaxID=633813 RepID=A0A1M6RX95_9BACT|nr:crossover junction endodeoxyribonuclease RuvC [Rhodothermus profundi]SHK37060.1 Holliday junction endonuclease RuvC [Rhodothermus profundi]
MPLSPERTETLIILGIDPGSRHTGYGVLAVEGERARVVAVDVIHLDAQASHPLRLLRLFEQLSALVDRYRPDECALEMPVYGRNPQSMLKLGRAQAAAMLAVLTRQIPTVEYTPKEVKKALTGRGNATKEQVRFMVQALLDLPSDQVKLALDASDALAVAVCHWQHRTRLQPFRGHTSWARFVQAHPERLD